MLSQRSHNKAWTRTFRPGPPVSAQGQVSPHLVGAVVLSHLLPHQEDPLIPLQLLVHGLVQGVSDRHLLRQPQLQNWSQDQDSILTLGKLQNSSSCFLLSLSTVLTNFTYNHNDGVPSK